MKKSSFCSFINASIKKIGDKFFIDIQKESHYSGDIAVKVVHVVFIEIYRWYIATPKLSTREHFF